MSDKIVWALVFGIIGGFSFAVGTSLYAKSASKLKIGGSTAGSALGSPSS